MEINLITKEEYETLMNIQKNFPNLTYDHKGYEGNMNALTEEDKQQQEVVIAIISKSVIGYSQFNHFVMRGKKRFKEPRAVIRLQYNYGAARKASEETRSFTGVGYLRIEELYKGFD